MSDTQPTPASTAESSVENAVEIKDLSFAYGSNGFDLAIPQLSIADGERVVCIGPSGSGKTTFLHLLAGILTPRTGALKVRRQNLERQSDPARRDFRSREVGLVFQEFELLEHLTVRENILLPYFINRKLRLDVASVEERLHRLASRVGMDGLLARRPRHLSHGERQRVAICRALITEPSLVLADEPTGNLDPDNAGEILDLLLDQVTERSATLLVVTHDHAILERFDRVIDFDTFRRKAR